MNRLVVPASCAVHRGPAGFCNVAVSKLDGAIELDPHVDGSCKITLTEDGATALRDWLGEVLG